MIFALVRDEIRHLDLKCEQLIEMANAHGGTDNITVILVRYDK